MDDDQINSVIEPPEKTPRLNFVAWVVVGSALLIGCVFGAVMMLRGINAYDSKIIVEGKDDVDEEPRGPSKKEVVADIPVEEKVHYLGDEKNGYVRVIGEEWEKLDREWSKGVQYYAGMYVLLLSALDSNTGSAKDYAQSLYDIAVPTLNVENVTLEKRSLGKYEEAYYLVMRNEETSSWNVEWIFKAEDDKIHYILVQGTDLNNEKFNIAETFTLERPEDE